MTTEAIASTRHHGGNPWAAAQPHGDATGELLDFSVDVNPCGCPASVRRLILEHLDDIERYPEPSAQRLRDAIAATHGISAAHIVVGNGSAELIALIPRVQPIARALIIGPTFTEYAWAVEQAQGAVEYVFAQPNDRFMLSWDESSWRRRLAAVDAVFLCNPNNPTGTLLSRRQVRQLAQWCAAAETQLIVDEAFLELTDEPAATSVVPDIVEFSHLSVIRSLTKSHAIPGLRLGYLAASEVCVDRLRAAQPAWPLNAFALAVGPALLHEHAYLERSRCEVAQLRRQLSTALDGLPGLQPYPSTTNFILCRVTHPALTSAALTERLAGEGLLIRNCDSFPGLDLERFIRVAVRRASDNVRLVSALERIMRRAG